MWSARPRILVVDDNEATLYHRSHVLRRAGFEVLEAATGAEGMRLIAEDAPRAVVLDVHLPDADGRALCRRIKGDPATASIVVLQMSATFVRDVDTVESLESGADASLTEPVDPGVLVATIRALLRARRAEDALREALTRAEAAHRAKDEFLATLSHELRSPLASVLTWATMLRSGRLDAEQADRAVTSIERNARMQVKLIEDLLDMSRIASGKLSLDAGTVDLAGVVDAAVESVRPLAEAKRLDLTVAPGTVPHTFTGDAARLQQVLTNLLSNAVKFTPAGGRVHVRVTADATTARIDVIDTGLGIEPALLPHIFERFRQGDSSSTRREGGLGLGLAIVQHLVQLHGGRVDAFSDGPGRGARFTVSLPLQASRDPAPVALPGLAPLERLDGVRVLLVDDEEDAREATSAVLRTAGAEVTAVASAAQALERLRTDPAHVLITDIAMPQHDGYALLRTIRALDTPSGEVPVIALTAYASVDEESRAHAAGFARHLSKPVEPLALVGTVAAVVGRGSG